VSDKVTPTQLLVSCMEDFGRCEPTDALVIYINESGQICWNTSNKSLVVSLGMIELTKHHMLAKVKS